MSVCKSIKGYTRQHERLADFFSLMAVALFFATLFLSLSYHSLILNWIMANVVVHGLLVVAGLVLDVALIFVFLNFGAARFSEEEEGCFHTFKGRRAGTGSLGLMFNSWLHHMEHVGKKHR
ncbi:cell division protein BolA [bacterium endosymbiont of Escarpia laminata]|nr:MAG: cell division protein BolA [bacterium endosymbiont of Escarpia laminata]RLJ18608.1 MAG: cell division protein BolA [bacterium endosymbiont of Escarpia laminata]